MRLSKRSVSIQSISLLLMLIVLQLKERELHELTPMVEGRDCDDWMIVDAGNIIFQFFTEGAISFTV
jgi:ribosomal silencing factor RsfS